MNNHEFQKSEIAELTHKEMLKQIFYRNTKSASRVLHAVNHPFRKKLMDLLREHGELSVTDLYIKTRSEQSIVSTHLGLLRRAGFVNAERRGKNIFYSVNEERVKQVAIFCRNLVN